MCKAAKRVSNPCITLAFGFLLLMAQPVTAGGLYVSEFGTVDMSSAGSGTLVRANDAATALVNPAGMTKLDSHQLNLGLAPGFGLVRFDQDSDSPNIASNNGGDQGGFIPLLSASYVHKISDRFRFGLGVFSISGASLDPKSDWAGRNQVRNIQLFTLSFVPSLAVRITDWLSVGAGAGITYAHLDWKLSPPVAGVDIDAELDDLEDWAASALVSVMIEPHEDFRIGITYQSETDLELDGNVKSGGPFGGANAQVNLPLAQAIRMDLRWQATDDLAFTAGWAWEDWDTLETTALDLGPVESQVRLGFKDTWKLRGGIHYRINEKWLAQTGLSYDSSALNTSDRTVALPIDEQWRFGIGGTHEWSETTRVGFGFQYTNLGDGSVDNAAIKGDYKDNHIFFFMVNMNFSQLPWDGMATF